MKHETFVWRNKSINFKGTTHTMKQEIQIFFEIYFLKLIVLREKMLHNFRGCCHVFHWFKWKDYNKLNEIYFLIMHWAANMLHAIYLWNMFRAICFIGVRQALQLIFIDLIFERMYIVKNTATLQNYATRSVECWKAFLPFQCSIIFQKG